MSSNSASNIRDSDVLELDEAVLQQVAAHFRAKYADRMTSSASTATPVKLLFESRVSKLASPKSTINALILDYLTMEGYPRAAANFSEEANLQPQQDEPSISARQEIQHAIHLGHINEAINSLNMLDPEILDRDPKLHFALLRLQLIELIRGCNGGDITPAMTFAQEHLGPRASTNPRFLQDLEQTMSLLLFPIESLPAENKFLLEPQLRRDVANQVNESILHQRGQRREAVLRALIKTRAWSENTARDSNQKLPPFIELGFNGEHLDGMDHNAHENGHEPMITT